MVKEIEKTAQVEMYPQVSYLLPLEKLYTVQIGHKSFKLSGASLSSDSPSYFTEYFKDEEKQNSTLMIDRSPEVFVKIQLHLQGYYIEIDNAIEFTYLFADAHYYKLPRLKKILYLYDYFATIGGRGFRIPRKLVLIPGDYPNFLSISYDAAFRDPQVVVAMKNMLRPPPQENIVVGDRSAQLFHELLRTLEGDTVHVRDETHRADLIQECRYYNFKALEQQFVKCKISTNPFTLREEITMGSISDISPRTLLNPTLNAPRSPSSPADGLEFVPLQYKRPYLDQVLSLQVKEVYRELILQISLANLEITKLSLDTANNSVFLKLSPQYSKTYLAKFGRFLPDREDIIRSGSGKEIFIVCDLEDCHCTINGKSMPKNWLDNVMTSRSDGQLSNGGTLGLPEKHVIEFKLLQSQWKLNVQGSRVVARGLKIMGISDTYNMYSQAAFL
ncbi:hypothetical protein BABINDRAFT_35630 [Babjeviella inositovora NRRL Y-12698]|uniref:BTB domain-containing protein n=1 Tax=Babjeviella inositovora NRRL Y-12698 TaxID=984486 RepID=A0A1E3QR70_9ASCO|nr:uncharacterized protein BABINDRAFT_35630 [Babjeviella inositovora NRRL Y-12698]ODQ80189.1 hypothetical protein BABINDRAFT_35630 [Babjeviella inositovora NRRL Y-12698]